MIVGERMTDMSGGMTGMNMAINGDALRPAVLMLGFRFEQTGVRHARCEREQPNPQHHPDGGALDSGMEEGAHDRQDNSSPSYRHPTTQH